MFKNIFNTPDSLRNTFLGQDELRARSQQGLQAMKSGVESLRTVLANNPIDPQHQQQQGQQQDSIRTMSPEGSIAESVTESIKSLGSGLGLGQLAGGLGLTGHMSGASGGAGGKFGRPAMARRTESGLKTGVKTEEASKETAALLAKIRAQQDVALERAKRMPEVEQMTQRYQDSWTEIHNHTTRNSERADDADEILQKVLELCRRHATTSEQWVEEAKDIKQLDQSLGEIMSLTENIQQKLVGLESAIEKLEEDAEVMTLADWKKSQVNELDKYMESKRKELWNKAELLSKRSDQFQKEEAARKLRLYQNQFETDMERFRRTQEERQQDLWKLAEAENDPDSVEVIETLGGTQQDLESALSKQRDLGSTQATTLAARTATTAAALRRLRLGDDEVSKAVLANPSSLLGYQDDYEDEELREKEDLDRFLGPATESDSKEGDGDDAEEEDESESEVGESPSDEEEDTSEEEEEDEETSEEDEDLDPIEKARRARAAVAAAAATGKNSKAATGSTISAFSALAKYSSTTSLINP
ncbi:MAG: hypothetical protein JOS17DRAFT_770915 [Linnemannia elongata]|nr:MAG: hypothetical protein JOS17DRAFT_770915 [Linnemannia elongata]